MIVMEAQASRSTMVSATTASAVLMIQPNTFGFDNDTAVTNRFQHRQSASPAAITARAMEEFAHVYDGLTRFGIDVVTYAHELSTYRPNAVFPNNWLTTWPDGRVFVYPMAHASRRIERVPRIIDDLRLTFRVEHVIDLSDSERRGQYLEGTGAIVFDHGQRRAYGCRSPRCDPQLFTQHVLDLGYEPILFAAHESHGDPVYHTNVMMGIQRETAVICSEAITDVATRQFVVASLMQGGRRVIELTLAQLDAYCGNLLQLRNRRGETAIIMSQTAHDAFSRKQLACLSEHNQLIAVAVPTIQDVGGGGIRCMVAEMFLPYLAS